MKTLIKNILPQREKERHDILIEGSYIVEARPAGSIAEINNNIIDGTDYVLFPAFVDAHSHSDKTMLGLEWFNNTLSDRIAERISFERTNRKNLGIDSYVQAKRAISLAIANGTLFMRSHVDIDPLVKLSGVEGIMQARQEFADIFDLQLVAFPQSGIVRDIETYELIERSLLMGVDLMGGIDPAVVERDPKGSVDTIFELAHKHGVSLDVHLHERGELGAFDLELMLEKVEAYEMQGMLTISHGLCLDHRSDYYEDLSDRVAKCNVSIITGGQAYIPSIPMVKPLIEKGILVAGGNDSLRDVWSPYGTGDMLERAQFIAMRNLFRRDDDLNLAAELVTYNGAKLLGIENYGTDVGDKANLTLVRGRNVAECVATSPTDRIVIRNGKVIATNGELN